MQDEKYLDAYARYFGKFIDAYREKGIPVYMVMPQDEPRLSGIPHVLGPRRDRTVF